MIGHANSQRKIDDFKRDAVRLQPRYAALITPLRAQDESGHDEIWTFQRLIDSASYGDVRAAQWRLYGAGGLTGESLDLRLDFASLFLSAFNIRPPL